MAHVSGCSSWSFGQYIQRAGLTGSLCGSHPNPEGEKEAKTNHYKKRFFIESSM